MLTVMTDKDFEGAMPQRK